MKRLLPLLLFLSVACGDRYTISQRGNVTLRTDRISGKTEMLTKDSAGKLVWTPVVEETAQTKAAADERARSSAKFSADFDQKIAADRKAECEKDRQKYERYREEYREAYGFFPPPTQPNPFSNCE